MGGPGYSPQPAYGSPGGMGMAYGSPGNAYGGMSPGLNHSHLSMASPHGSPGYGMGMGVGMGASPHSGYGAYKPSTAGGADLTSMQKSKSRPTLKKKQVWQVLQLDPIQGNEIRDTTYALRQWLAHAVFPHVLKLLRRVNERLEQAQRKNRPPKSHKTLQFGEHSLAEIEEYYELEKARHAKDARADKKRQELQCCATAKPAGAFGASAFGGTGAFGKVSPTKTSSFGGFKTPGAAATGTTAAAKPCPACGGKGQVDGSMKIRPYKKHPVMVFYGRLAKYMRIAVTESQQKYLKRRLHALAQGEYSWNGDLDTFYDSLDDTASHVTQLDGVPKGYPSDSEIILHCMGCYLSEQDVELKFQDDAEDEPRVPCKGLYNLDVSPGATPFQDLHVIGVTEKPEDVLQRRLKAVGGVDAKQVYIQMKNHPNGNGNHPPLFDVVLRDDKVFHVCEMHQPVDVDSKKVDDSNFFDALCVFLLFLRDGPAEGYLDSHANLSLEELDIAACMRACPRLNVDALLKMR